AIDWHIEVAKALVAIHHDAAARRLYPSARSANVQRLASHHTRNRVARVHGVGIHDPCHRLLVGVDVRSGYILLRPDKVDDLCRITARQALQFALAHLLGIADYAALGSAKRNVDDRALPSHP